MDPMAPFCNDILKLCQFAALCALSRHLYAVMLHSLTFLLWKNKGLFIQKYLAEDGKKLYLVNLKNSLVSATGETIL